MQQRTITSQGVAISYGLKRWGFGYVCGASLIGGLWAWDMGRPTASVILWGIALAVFFGDHIVATANEK